MGITTKGYMNTGLAIEHSHKRDGIKHVSKNVDIKCSAHTAFLE